MKINKLELKNISYYERGSEETPCYNATVYVNGKKAIEVSKEKRYLGLTIGKMENELKIRAMRKFKVTVWTRNLTC